MFTHQQHTFTSRFNHRNKPFYKIAICYDPTSNSTVFVAEPYQSIYHFYHLSEKDVQQLNLAIKLYKNNEDDWNASKVVIQFLEERYKLGGKEAEQIDTLIKTNNYYKEKLKHFKHLTQSMSDSKTNLTVSPEKRKQLTDQFTRAEDFQDVFACDALIKNLDSSQLYNQSPSQSMIEELKVENPQPFAFNNRSHATFFSTSSNSVGSPLNQRSKGGNLVWDSLQKRFILSAIPDPFVTPVTTQDDTLNQLLSNYNKPV